MLVAWSQEQARLRAEAERKAREEAERAERARREAEAAEAKRIADLEAAKAKGDATAVASASGDAWASLEAADKAEEAKAAARAVVVPVPPPKVAGIRLRQVQCHEVEDVLALYKARPDLVRLEPIRGAINAALEAGETLPGVRAWKEGRA